MNKADIIHKKFIESILTEGTFDENPRPRYKSDGQPAYSKFITQAYEEYDISKGELPITTLRPIAIKGGINELLAIYQTQTNTREGFESHSVRWWEDWMNEDGNIGRAYSYNLESHRPNEMKREVVKVKRKIVDEKLGEIKEVGLINPIEESIDGIVYFSNSDSPFGIGYLGNYKSVKNFKDEHIKILMTKWESMFKRCYGQGDKNKKNYQDKNIFVHQDWHSFEQFLKDVRYLPQYHLAKEDDFAGWDLDKDYYGSNCYSKDTCVFLNHQENVLYSKVKPLSITDKSSGKEEIFLELTKASEYIGVSYSALKTALYRNRLDKGVYKNYIFKYIENDNENLYRYELSRNQINELIKSLKEDAYSRRHMLSFYNWSNQDKKMLVECAFQSLISVRNVDGEKYLDWTLIMRSSDYLVAGFINCIQYVALQMMIAHHLGYKVGKFARFTQNLHIYSRHEEQARELLRREPSSDAKPKLILNADGKSFYDITADDFELVDYEPVRPQLKFDLGV